LSSAAGITGSLAAQHLAARGVDVVVVDREQPGLGSTAASTAMLQWEIDCTLGELTNFYGFDRAETLYQRSAGAVQGLSDLVGSLGIDCSFRPRSTLYLSAGEVGPAALRDEHLLRRRAGLPGVLLDHAALLSGFDIDRVLRFYRRDLPRPIRCCCPGGCCAMPKRGVRGLSMRWSRSITMRRVR
jgi:glycine/D-amino acid oxidase-like deaminating enzyme